MCREYSVDLIEMGFCKDDNGTTADDDMWHTDKHDMLNVLVTEHTHDGSGQVELILDIDFPPSLAGMANTFCTICTGLANYANTHDVPFGTVVNPYD